MAERDKVIKSGQLTLPRILFLAAVGGVIAATVALGGIWLTIGYWLLTIGICVLLYLIAIDYGISMDRISLKSQPAQAASAAEPAAATAEEARTTMGEPRPKRRTTRQAKRRR
jgi:hypothetical protein